MGRQGVFTSVFTSVLTLLSQHLHTAAQVEGLCAMAEGVQALLVGAEATAAALQAGHDAVAFGGHAHIDSPAVLIRNALW